MEEGVLHNLQRDEQDDDLLGVCRAALVAHVQDEARLLLVDVQLQPGVSKKGRACQLRVVQEREQGPGIIPGGPGGLGGQAHLFD